MKTAVWGNGEAYNLAYAEVRGVAALCDPSGALFLPAGYPQPIVDLGMSRARALDAFRNLEVTT